jgi:hypothetical protein
MDDLSTLHPHGIFLRREALAAGYDDRELYRALSHGRIARVRHGAYVDRQTWDGARDVAKHLMRSHAVGLTHRQPSALSHTSGAIAHGVRVWNLDLSRVHLTRSLDTVGRRHNDIRYHLGSVDRAVQVTGTPTLPAAASALGACCLGSVEAGVVLLDSGYDLGLFTPAEVFDEFQLIRGWPGTARLQITLRLARNGAQSVGESRMRYLFWATGIPRPELQYEVREGGVLVGSADFAWPHYGLLGEFDGRIKYEKLLKPGESASDVVFREKQREDRMREATGWSMIRFTWSDLYDQRRTSERVRRALMRRA